MGMISICLSPIAKGPHPRGGMSTAAEPLPAGDVVFYVFALACIVAIVATLVCLYLRCGYSLLRDRTDTTQLPLWTV